MPGAKAQASTDLSVFAGNYAICFSLLESVSAESIKGRCTLLPLRFSRFGE